MKRTTERRALNALLAMFPDFDVLGIDWQLPSVAQSDPGPWLLVRLGQRSEDGGHAWAVHEFAIWKYTGAVHGVDGDGAVIDPPILRVS